MSETNNKVIDINKLARDSVDPFKIRCRNDRILVQIKIREEIRGIKMSQNSVEGKEYYIVSVGPDVKDLKPGDQVMIDSMEAIGEWAYLPGYSDFMFNSQKHAPLVLAEAPSTPAPIVDISESHQEAVKRLKQAEKPKEHEYETIPAGEHFLCDYIMEKVQSKKWDPDKVSETMLSIQSERQRLREFLEDFTTPVFNPNDYSGAIPLIESRKQRRMEDWKTAKPTPKPITEGNPRVVVISDRQFSIGGEGFAVPEGSVFDKANIICESMWGPGELISRGDGRFCWEKEAG